MGRSLRPSFIMAACTRQPTRPAPVPAGRAKGKKRRADDSLEEKTEVLEEGELAAWFLNEMDQATQTDPVPYAPVDRPRVWMCPLHPDETRPCPRVARTSLSMSTARATRVPCSVPKTAWTNG